MNLVFAYTTILIVVFCNYDSVITAAGGGNWQEGTPREFTVLHPPCQRQHGNLQAEPRTEGNAGRNIQSTLYFQRVSPPKTIRQHGTVTDFQLLRYYEQVPPPKTNVRHGLEDRPVDSPATADVETPALRAPGWHYGGPPLLQYTLGTTGAPDTTHVAAPAPYVGYRPADATGWYPETPAMATQTGMAAEMGMLPGIVQYVTAAAPVVTQLAPHEWYPADTAPSEAHMGPHAPGWHYGGPPLLQYTPGTTGAPDTTHVAALAPYVGYRPADATGWYPETPAMATQTGMAAETGMLPGIVQYATAAAPAVTQLAPHEWYPADTPPSEAHMGYSTEDATQFHQTDMLAFWHSNQTPYDACVIPPMPQHGQAVSPMPNPLEQGGSGFNIDAPEFVPAHNNKAAHDNVDAKAVDTHHGATSIYIAAGELENVATDSSSSNLIHHDQAASENDIDFNVVHLAENLETVTEKTAASGSSVIHHDQTFTGKTTHEFENRAAASSNSVIHHDQPYANEAADSTVDADRKNSAWVSANSDTVTDPDWQPQDKSVGRSEYGIVSGNVNTEVEAVSQHARSEEPEDPNWHKYVDWYEYSELHQNAKTDIKLGLATSANAVDGEQERRTLRQRHAREPQRQDAHMQQQKTTGDGAESQATHYGSQHDIWIAHDAKTGREQAQQGREHENWRAHNANTKRKLAQPGNQHNNLWAHNANTGREVAQLKKQHENLRAHNANTGRELIQPGRQRENSSVHNADTGRQLAQHGSQHEHPRMHNANKGRELAQHGSQHEHPRMHNANKGHELAQQGRQHGHPRMHNANTGRELAQPDRQHENSRVHNANTGRELTQLDRQHENSRVHNANTGRELTQPDRQHENSRVHNANTGRELAQPDRQHENSRVHNANTGRELAQPGRQHGHPRVQNANTGRELTQPGRQRENSMVHNANTGRKLAEPGKQHGPRNV